MSDNNRTSKTDLMRYGIKWNGPREPIGTPMDDGYWTPWHLAQAEIELLRDELRQTRIEVAQTAAEALRTIGKVVAPSETSRDPFEHTAILADPNTQRIKIAFQEKNDYEAALAFFGMADLPQEPRETPTSHCIDCIELKNALAAAVKVANEARECHDRDQEMRTMKLLIALSGHLPKWRADTDRIHDVLRRAMERLSAPMPPEEPAREHLHWCAVRIGKSCNCHADEIEKRLAEKATCQCTNRLGFTTKNDVAPHCSDCGLPLKASCDHRRGVDDSGHCVMCDESIMPPLNGD